MIIKSSLSTPHLPTPLLPSLSPQINIFLSSQFSPELLFSPSKTSILATIFYWDPNTALSRVSTQKLTPLPCTPVTAKVLWYWWKKSGTFLRRVAQISSIGSTTISKAISTTLGELSSQQNMLSKRRQDSKMAASL